METLTPDIPNTLETFSTQFCLGNTSSWSCSCGDLLTDHIEINSATRDGQCNVLMPKRYTIDLSDNWYCNAVGVFAHNLACVTAYGQKIFIQSAISELPLEIVDEAIVVYQEGEGQAADPVVQLDEQKLEREIKIVGSKKALRLLSKRDDLFILRYFVKNSDNLYVLIFESNELVKTDNMTILLEDIVDSMVYTQ